MFLFIGVINVVLTTPLWVANSRLKMQGAKISTKDSKVLNKHPKYDGIIGLFVIFPLSFFAEKCICVNATFLLHQLKLFSCKFIR